MGLINITAIADGMTADDELWNSRFAIIVNEINGHIGTTNLEDGAVTTSKLGAQAVTAAKIETQQTWITPTLLNGWVQYDSVHSAVGYMKDSLGFVHLRGMIKTGGASHVLTLPAGYRPARVIHFPGVNGGAAAYTRIAGETEAPNSGKVTLSATTATWYTLDGICFQAEA